MLARKHAHYRHTWNSALVVAFSLFVLTGSARAGVVYSNLGSGLTVYGPGSWTISAFVGLAPAFSFIPASTANFAELDIPIWYGNGTNLATVALLSDASGLPGAVLESWNITGTTSFTCCTLRVLLDSSSIVLNGGTTYWVAEEAANSNDFGGSWPQNTTGATGLDCDLVRGCPGPAVTSGAFQVLSTASSQTPEPGAFGLLIAGVVAMAVKRRYSRTA